MKNLYLAMLAVCGITLASAATGNNNGSAQNGSQITLTNADSWVSDGVFAISFELDHPLNQIPYFEFNIFLGDGKGNGEGNSTRVDIASMVMYGDIEALTMTATNSTATFTQYSLQTGGPFLPDATGPFIVQYNLNERNVTFSYVKDDSILELASITLKPEASLPPTIAPAASGITFTTGEGVGQPSDAYGTIDNVTTWHGEVSAEEVKNPPAPAPAVPEPATATLGLLALCGLATRRRRK